ANLRYLAFSGALNESIADSFAAFIDDDGDKWQVGEDLPRRGPLRYMDHPTRRNHPDHWDRKRAVPAVGRCRGSTPRCGDDHVCLRDRCRDISRDKGYVHVNSGIPNKATWLMAAEPIDTVRRHRRVKARSIGEEKTALLM